MSSRRSLQQLRHLPAGASSGGGGDGGGTSVAVGTHEGTVLYRVLFVASVGFGMIPDVEKCV